MNRSNPSRIRLKRLLVAAVVLIALAGLVFHLHKNREIARRNSCAANMKQIYGATISIALENRLYRGDEVPRNKLVLGLKNNVIPDCPSGGSYVLPVVLKSPACSFHGPLYSEAELTNSPASDKEKGILERPKE